MLNGKYSYGYIAINDLYYLYNTRVYAANPIASIMQGVVEKLLKHVISNEISNNEEVLKSCNLPKLVDAISSLYNVTPMTFKNLKLLSYAYYEVRYPGDNFINVDDETLEEYIECTNSVLSWFMEKVNIELLHTLYCEVTQSKRLTDDYLEDTIDNRNLLTQLLNIHPLEVS